MNRQNRVNCVLLTGYRTRLVECVRKDDGSYVNDKVCLKSGGKPAMQQACNTQPCQPEWVWKQWHKLLNAEKLQINLFKNQMSCKTSPFASVNQHHWNPRTAFHDRLKFFLSWFSFRRWYLSGWRPCSKTCGKGIQLRTIVCRRKKSQEHYETVEESSCTEQKPVGNLQQECNMIACPAEWKHLAWSEVNTEEKDVERF